MHGKKCTIKLDNTCLLFHGLPQHIDAARYHSLAAREETIPAQLQVIAEDDIGEVMAVKHEKYKVYGVQFHPESIMTSLGHVILQNFLKLTYVCEIRNGKLTSYEITPEKSGFSRCALEDLVGGSPAENAQITVDILTGKERGPKRDVVVLNSAMALYLGIDNCTVSECIKKAQDIIDTGKAAAKLEQFSKLTNEVTQ